MPVKRAHFVVIEERHAPVDRAVRVRRGDAVDGAQVLGEPGVEVRLVEAGADVVRRAERLVVSERLCRAHFTVLRRRQAFADPQSEAIDAFAGVDARPSGEGGGFLHQVLDRPCPLFADLGQHDGRKAFRRDEEPKGARRNHDERHHGQAQPRALMGGRRYDGRGLRLRRFGGGIALEFELARAIPAWIEVFHDYRRAVAPDFELLQFRLGDGIPAPVFRGKQPLALGALRGCQLFAVVVHEIPAPPDFIVEPFNPVFGEIGRSHGRLCAMRGGCLDRWGRRRRDIQREVQHHDRVHEHARDPKAKGEACHNRVVAARPGPGNRQAGHQRREDWKPGRIGEKGLKVRRINPGVP